MIYVGIDIAKQKHFASIMDSDGVIISQPFSFTNDFNGFQKLLDNISSFSKDSEVTFECSGDDENDAMAKVEELVSQNFGD